jgi:hypothetical protein
VVLSSKSILLEHISFLSAWAYFAIVLPSTLLLCLLEHILPSCHIKYPTQLNVARQVLS